MKTKTAEAIVDALESMDVVGTTHDYGKNTSVMVLTPGVMLQAVARAAAMLTDPHGYSDIDWFIEDLKDVKVDLSFTTPSVVMR